MGVGEDLPELLARRVIVTNAIALIMSLLSIAYTMVLATVAPLGATMTLAALVPVFFAVLGLNGRGLHTLAKCMLLATIIGGIGLVVGEIDGDVHFGRLLALSHCILPLLVFGEAEAAIMVGWLALTVGAFLDPLWLRALFPELSHFPIPAQFMEPVGISAALSSLLLIACALRYSARREAQSEAASAELRFRKEMHAKNSPLAFVEFDVAGKITSWNPGAESIFGYTSREALGMDVKWLRSAVQDEKSRANQAWSRLLAAGAAQQKLSQCRRKDGSELVIESFNTPLIDREGKVSGLASIMRDVSASLAAEAEVQREQELYKMTFDSASGGICHVSTIGIILRCNGAYAEMLGYTSPDDLCGRSLRDITHPDDIADNLKFIAKEAAGGTPQHFEKRYIRRDGAIVYALVSARFFLASTAGGESFHVAVVQDISQKKLDKQRLRASNALLESVLRALPVAVFGKSVDDDFKYSVWNQAAETLFGRSAAQALGKTDFELLPETEAARARARDVATLAEQGLIESQEELAETAIGVSILHTRRTVVRDDSGKAILVLGISQDLTQQRRTEGDLGQLITAIENSAIVAETDVSGKITKVNDRFCQISGYSREELLGQDHRIVNSGYQSQEFFRALWATIRSGAVWTGEIKNRAKDGSYYWVQTVITPIKDLAGVTQKYLAVRFDMSEMKRQEEALEAQRAVSVTASKMAALGEMASGIAHEINSPLAIIYGRSRLLQVEFGEFPRVVEGFASIEKNAVRISKIVKGLRAFARNADDDEMEVCAVSSVITDAVELCRPKIRDAGVELREGPVPATLDVTGRAVQLTQVLVNLLGNAVDAFADRPAGVDAPAWIATEVRASDAGIEIRVSDSGPGVPPAVRDKIMRPFFTTKPVGKGTGLGLSISSGIIASHGGRLYLDEASPDTCFVIFLPSLTQAPVPEQPARSSA